MNAQANKEQFGLVEASKTRKSAAKATPWVGVGSILQVVGELLEGCGPGRDMGRAVLEVDWPESQSWSQSGRETI